MTFENQIILVIIDKLIIGIIILLVALIINQSLEKFKSVIIRQNKIKDIKYEKISIIIEQIWSCNSALNEMVANFAKTNASEPFKGLAESIEKDTEFKEKLLIQYRESASKYGESVSTLQKKVNSSYFWLGKELSEKAQIISLKYYNFAIAIINNDSKNKASESLDNIDTEIREFEEAAIKYIG